MLGIYRTAGDRYGWWAESVLGIVSHATCVFALLVSFLSFGRLFTTWDVDWLQHFLEKRKVYVDYENTGLESSAEAKVHYVKEE